MRRTNMPSELAGKRLELIKETIAKLSLGLCYGGVILLIQVRPSWKESQEAARELRRELDSMEVRNQSDFGRPFKDAVKAGSDALSVTPPPFFSAHPKRITQLTVKNRLPAI